MVWTSCVPAATSENVIFYPGRLVLGWEPLPPQRILVFWLSLVAVVENMRTWEHSGFSVDQSVFLPAGDQAGIERLIQYMTRCPFSLSRLVKVSNTGQVVYQAEKQACRAFPDPQVDGLESRRAAEFPDPLPARVSRRVHSADSTEGIPSCPLLWLVFEQEPGHAEEGSGSNGVRR